MENLAAVGVLVVETVDELAHHVGAELGPSEWLHVTQHQIDVFAELTQDRHWVHIDQRRAATELPFGSTIAHGLLSLAFLPRLCDSLLQVRNYRHGLNYGCNRVRFTAPVRAGARIRSRVKIDGVDPIEGGIRLTLGHTLEVDDNAKLALIAETVILMYR